MPAKPAQQRGPLGAGRGRGSGGERARRGCRLAAQVEKGPHTRRGRLVRALGEKGRRAVRVGPGDRVEVPVQDYVPGRGGEQVGVGGAEPGAVGHAQVVQHRGADRLAQQVHVTGHIGGGVMVQQAAVALSAPRVEPGPGPYPGRVLPGADGEHGRAAEGHVPEELALRRHGREAAHRGAVAEPAGVERDDVEPSRQRRRELPEAGHQDLDLLGRAAGVEEQRPRAASRIGRQVPDHGDADRRAARVAVAQWHPGGGALEPAVAGAPVQHRNRWRGRRRPHGRHCCRGPRSRRSRAGRRRQDGGEQNGRS